MSDSSHGGGEFELGAPKMHGELLKLGFGGSEVTINGVVSIQT